MESKTLISSIRENIGKVMVGSEETINLLLTALIAEGHVLIEDVPGMGKTVLAKSLAKSVSLEFNRIQFTPDLLPSDVTGLNYFDQKANDFVFSPGPAFCNLLLADEINRAMTEALGREVYHYHLHVVYVPVVEKQILWSKRCKDKALVGTVKETVMQVSRSKKWASKPPAGRCWRARPAKERQTSPEEVVQHPARRFLQLYAQCWVHGCRAR